MVEMFVQDGEYNKGWLGMVYAGATYSYMAVLISSIPTIVLGWPASLMADKYGCLRKQIILLGAALLGGVFLVASGALFFKATDFLIILWLFVAGALGGLLNGGVFLRYLKPHNRFNPDAN